MSQNFGDRFRFDWPLNLYDIKDGDLCDKGNISQEDIQRSSDQHQEAILCTFRSHSFSHPCQLVVAIIVGPRDFEGKEHQLPMLTAEVVESHSFPLGEIRGGACGRRWPINQSSRLCPLLR